MVLDAIQKSPGQFLLNHFGVIAVHETGTGKTLTAIYAADLFLDKYPQFEVLILVPNASLVHNFEMNIRKYKLSEPKRRRTSVTTFRKLEAQPDACAGRLVIVDEAHHARNAGKLFDVLFACAQKCSRLLLLTATPMYNQIHDLANMLALVKGTRISASTVTEAVHDAASRRKLLACTFSYKAKDARYYPTQVDHDIYLDMSPSYVKNYEDIVKNNKVDAKILQDVFNGKEPSEHFMQNIRRGMLAWFEDAANPKLIWLSDFLTAKRNQEPCKVIVYCEWLQGCVAQVARLCDSLQIKCSMFTGKVPQKQRDEAVRAYNDTPGNEMLCFIISQAGSEGLDLKETRAVVIMDLAWNPSKMEQAVARAVRYKSHKRPDAVVDVYYLILRRPPKSWIRRSVKTWIAGPELASSDTIFMDRLIRKRGERKVLLDAIKQLAIENADGRDCAFRPQHRKASE